MIQSGIHKPIGRMSITTSLVIR